MKKLLRVFHLGLWGPSVRDGVDWEIRHHLDERIEELMGQGMNREDAEVEARRTLGDEERLRRQLNSIDAGTTRRLRLGVWLEAFVQDLRFGLRAVRLNPGFASAVVLALGLGLGATVAMFAVLDALLLRPLPYRAPHELAGLVVMDGASNFGQPYVDMKHGLRMRESNTFFSSMFVHARTSMLYTGGTEAQDVTTQAVSPEFEETLGVQPIIGRGLVSEDARPGARPVITIDYRFWQTALGGATDILQRTVELNGVPFLVVGVMPRGFKFPQYSTTEVWFPIPDNGVAMGERLHSIGVLGRISGSFDQANQRAVALGRSLFTVEKPDSKYFYQLERLDNGRARGNHVKQSTWLLAGAVTLILLVAVVNVVNLLLIRLSSRTRELAVRLALGAGRLRLTRQLITEFMTLAFLSGFLALLVALLTLRAMTAIMPDSITFYSPFAIALEQRALWFAFASTVACGLMVTIAPAIAASRQARTSGEDMTRYAARTRGKLRVRSALVMIQVALSVVLLVGAGLLLNSFVRLIRVDTGINPDNLAIATFYLKRAGHPDAAERGQYLRRIEEQLEALPGVQGVSLSAGTPPSGGGFMMGLQLQAEGESALPGGEQMILPFASVRSDFFQVTGARLLAGRVFTDQDDRKSTVIIDEDLARALWPGRPAVGRRFRIRPKEPLLTVVGVMADLKLMGQDDRQVKFEVLFPYGDYSQAETYTTIAIRTARDPKALLPAIRNVIREIDPRQPIHEVQTARAAFADAIDMPRFMLVLVAALGVLALTLAAIGIYGVLSYGVSQRMHEFSVRAALGARASDLRRMIVKHGFGLAALGATLGLAGALATTRFLRGQLYHVQPTDTLTLGLVIALMLIVALLACLQPARRASRIDPARTLRTD